MLGARSEARSLREKVPIEGTILKITNGSKTCEVHFQNFWSHLGSLNSDDDVTTIEIFTGNYIIHSTNIYLVPTLNQ